MADILKSLGDAMERQQQRKHENNMEVLRAINTRPGMIVLGVILLGAALALIWPQIAPEADNTNSIVIDMSDFDFGDEEMNRTVQEMVENDRKQKEQSGRSGAPEPVENSAMPSAETDSRDDRFENLKRLYEAGILSREEYDARRKKL